MTQTKAAVIGSPISHSLSPGIFSFIADRLGITDFGYRAEKIGSEGLRDFIAEVRSDKSTIGLNVTIPHKESILQLLDQLSPDVQAIGAANVVHRKSDLLSGHNTDVHGILMTLEKHHCSIEGKRALVFGAGGAARAVAYALGTQRAKQVDFLNHNLSRAKALVKQFSDTFKETRFQSLPSPTECTDEPIELLINATPLGMSGQTSARDGLLAADYFDHARESHGLYFSKSAFAFDLIYNPEITPFLISAQKWGLRPIGGLDMLVEQALQTWRIWFGPTPELLQLKQELMDFLRYRPIFLTGFMGVGKSTVGAILAKKLNWQFLDIDSLIERDTQMSISEIFQKQGEPVFREIESRHIRRHSFSPRTVIALGGGALTCEATRKTIEKSGRLVFLQAQPDTLLERLKTSSQLRPLLRQSSEPLLQITTLLKERENLYNAARLKVETDHLTPEEIAHEIEKQL